MRNRRSNRIWIALPLLLLGASLGASGAHAAKGEDDWGDVRWEMGRIDNEYVARAYVDDGEEETDDFNLFNARCVPGKPDVAIWYYIERPVFPDQPVRKDEMRRGFRPQGAWAVIDGTEYSLGRVKMTPEELYGGNELTTTVPLDSPLLTAIRNGSVMRARIATFPMMKMRLKGSARAIDALVRACTRP